jgi:DNA-binding protein H-NS
VKNLKLKSMTMDELWSLREHVESILAGLLTYQKAKLELRLRKLSATLKGNHTSGTNARRPYPKVFPKYRNPARPAETWTGRGMMPRWLTAQLRSGKKLDDFRIVSEKVGGRRLP